MIAASNAIDQAEAIKKGAKEEAQSNIPEIIEEKRKDSEGRVVTYKYLKGKLLGKVYVEHMYYFYLFTM
jgi:hypothetical protein